MPFETGRTVIHEAEVAGFVTRTVVVVASIADRIVSLQAAAGRGLPGTYRLDNGERLEPSGSASERIVEVPAPPTDLWGPRSGWISADAQPQREGWYEFRRAVDGAVDLCYFVAGAWLTADEHAPLTLTGGESWQGLAGDPVEIYLDAEPVAAEAPAKVAQPEARETGAS